MVGMSLLDTLATDEDDEWLAADILPDEHLAATIEVIAKDDAEMAMLLGDEAQADAVPTDPVLAEVPVAPAAVPGPKRARKRRGPPVDVAEDGSRVPMTKSEKCSLAAKRRWEKRALPAARGPAQVLGAQHVVHIPFEQLQVAVYAGTEAQQIQVVSAFEAPLRSPKNNKAREVFKENKHVASSVAISKHLGIHRDTVKAKMRHMAAVIAFGAKHRWWKVVMTVYCFFRDLAADFAPILHVQKQRFDEVMLTLRVNELPADWPAALLSNKKDVVRAKLMQINTAHACLFRAQGCHFSLEASLPTVIKPIESTHAELIKATCVDQSGEIPWVATAFQQRRRISVSDNHPSNALSDYSIWCDNPVQTLLRWICFLHVAHKVAELQWQCFRSELKGIMSSTIQCHNPGAFRAWKMGAKTWVQHTYKYREEASRPHDPAADAYRRETYKTFGFSQSRSAGPKSRVRQMKLHQRRRKFNGDFRVLDETTHYCSGPSCCRTPDEALRVMLEIIENETAPPLWALNRWLGSDASCDWHGYWINAHGIYVAAVLIGWLGIKSMSEVLRLMQEIFHGISAQDEPAPAYEETTKDMDDFTRQTTHRSNVKLWLLTHPVGRLWCHRRVIYVQQDHQKRWLRTSGPLWEQQQLDRLRRDKRRKYRPLLAYEFEIVDETLRQYGALLVQSDEWAFLPEMFQVNSLAMACFRTISKSSCAQFQLEKVRSRTYPAKGFAPLSDDPIAAVAGAESMLHDYWQQPCVMDPSSFDHCERYDTVAKLCGPESIAILTVLAIHSELENAGTEASNAYLRRRVVMCLQQTKPELTDVVADWVGKWSRENRRSIMGESETEDDGSSDDRVVRKPGGQARGFLSGDKDRFKDAKGRVCFTKAAAAYREEREQRPDSDALKAAAERGRLATLAGRVQAGKRKTDGDKSNFGTRRPRVERRVEQAAEQRALLQEFDARLAAADAVIHDGDLPLALVKKDEYQVVQECVLANSAGGLREEMEVLDKLYHAIAKRDTAMERETVRGMRAFVNQEPTIANVDLSGLVLPELGRLRLLRNSIPTLSWNDPMDEYSQRLVCDLMRNNHAVKDLLVDQFERRCRLSQLVNVDPLGEVGAGFRPTYCWKFGSGRCLCKGTGIVLDLWRQKSNNMVLILAPTATEQRRLLLESWVFARYGDSFFHIGLAYLNPVRCTYLRVNWVRDLDGGKCLLECRLADNDLPDTLTDVEVGESLDLQNPITLSLYKLTSTEQPHVPFSIGLRLVVEPLDKFLFMITNSVTFWKGSANELSDEFTRRQARAAREAERQRKATAKAAGAAPAPAAAPAAERSRRQRRVQRPVGAGLDAAMLALGGALPAPAGAVVEADVLFAIGDAVPAPGDALDVDGAAPDAPGGAGFAAAWRQGAADVAGRHGGIPAPPGGTLHLYINSVLLRSPSNLLRWRDFKYKIILVKPRGGTPRLQVKDGKESMLIFILARAHWCFRFSGRAICG